MYITRIPAISAAKMRLDPNAPRGAQMAELPPWVRWKADHYNHLFEQPTLFYPLVVLLAITPGYGRAEVWLAWGYVAMRVVHSVFQSTINKIEVRFVLFASSSLMLMGLAVRAAQLVFAG